MKNQFEFITVEKKSLSTFSLIFIALISALVALSVACYLATAYDALVFLLALLTVFIIIIVNMSGEELFDIEEIEISKALFKTRNRRKRLRRKVMAKIILATTYAFIAFGTYQMFILYYYKGT
jgi:amino acid transporter